MWRSVDIVPRCVGDAQGPKSGQHRNGVVHGVKVTWNTFFFFNKGLSSTQATYLLFISLLCQGNLGG